MMLNFCDSVFDRNSTSRLMRISRGGGLCLKSRSIQVRFYRIFDEFNYEFFFLNFFVLDDDLRMVVLYVLSKYGC